MNPEIKSFISSASEEELKQMKTEIEMEVQKRKGASTGPRIITYTDGASRGNPGPAGVGVLLYNEKDELLREDFQFIGETTNNEAEYRALILALDRARELTDGVVECYMDSQLLARQLNGQYALKSEKLEKFFRMVKVKAEQFRAITFHHVRENPYLQKADRLANKAIDMAKQNP